MFWFYSLPALVFVLLQLGEWHWPQNQPHRYKREDWILNIVGLFVQGVIVPFTGVLLSFALFPSFTFLKQGAIPLNWWGAFLLNFIVIDFLYYWQHRLFHAMPFLWKLHECHHSSPRVDIWATSRNNLWVNFLFVYILINPILGYLCECPEGFFAASMVTASLDILRHSNINFKKLLGYSVFKKLELILVMPWMHHSHHDMLKKPHNFGANFIIWDRIFKSFDRNKSEYFQYQPAKLNPYRQQFYYPFIR